MIQPVELKKHLPMGIANGHRATTTDVWNILLASKEGRLDGVKELADKNNDLLYAQYNYTPPIHFAVRENHIELVKYLLGNGAYDPSYKIYPFQEDLLTIAKDREYHDVVGLLEDYAKDPSNIKFKGDNGEIFYDRSETENEFQNAVDKGDLTTTEKILKQHPEFVHDDTFFWGEGILMMPAKDNNLEMVQLLMHYGAKVPRILKWTQNYYFKHYDMASFLIKNGMNANVMSWHHVTILHDVAQKGNIDKAELLIQHGADINAIDEEYQSTPLGMAAKWGHTDMVEYLLKQGADPNLSGAKWSTPLSWARKKSHHDMEAILMKIQGET
jgi:ankyrin repeat protein